MSTRLVLHLVVAEGTTDARVAELRALFSSGFRALAMAHVAEGTLARGEVCFGDFASVLTEDARPQARRRDWRGLKGEEQSAACAGVTAVREALDGVSNGTRRARR